MGRNQRGVRDRSGPYKDSYMYRTGHRGPRAGRRQGNC